MTTPNTLNLETVYIVTSHFYEETVLLTESEIPTIRRHLMALHLDEGYLPRDGDRILDCQADEFARIASPEELAHEVNLMLKTPCATTADLRNGLYAAPGTHDSTVIVGDGTAHIEGNAVDIINALWALSAFDGIEAVWTALADFPATCDCGCCIDCDDNDTEPSDTDTKPDHYEPSEAEFEHWQDMCHEQYTGA